ncbi:hypothetical protein QJS10_CPA05g01948 [Acorus calamus]|uniref:Reverse transcriptase zinc-binding domain-containing protein n=1 Tax=Acorus calamus TaxID=4465 RepID=A0AAV9EQI4_ACOCL|nr:hypothetical protein QJS10_CPA05g01948 [Acorus calamus]
MPEGNARSGERLTGMWKIKSPLKIKVFWWLLAKERLLTKVYRAKWCPAESVTCALCGADPETVVHLFCACRVVKDFWQIVEQETSLCMHASSVDELWVARDSLTSATASKAANNVLRLIIVAGAWSIWRARNEAIFKGSRVYVENLWESTASLISQWGRGIVGVQGVTFTGGRIIITE